MSRYLPRVLVFGLASASISLDQLTKHLVRTRLPFGETWAPIPALASVFDITHTTNTGAAFGMFQAAGSVITVIAFVVIAAIVYYSFTLERDHWPVAIALGLQLGGAVGNLIDRLRFGPVTDFVHVHNFPLFNVADASISVGVAVLALLLLSESRGGGEPEHSTREPVDRATPEPDAPA